jgi:hypothetical protein
MRTRASIGDFVAIISRKSSTHLSRYDISVEFGLNH